jgi:integrase
VHQRITSARRVVPSDQRTPSSRISLNIGSRFRTPRARIASTAGVTGSPVTETTDLGGKPRRTRSSTSATAARPLSTVNALHCGLRQGEILGLRWSDIDLEATTLQIRRTLSEARTGYRFEPPKNNKGRNIRLTTQAVEALREHLARQLEMIEIKGDLYQDQGLVVSSQVGTPMNGKNLTSRYFKPLLQMAGLPNIRFHDLRHTFATLMLQNGEHPKVVQEMLGHATIAITMDTYSHVLPNMQRDAVSRLGALLH